MRRTHYDWAPSQICALGPNSDANGNRMDGLSLLRDSLKNAESTSGHLREPLGLRSEKIYMTFTAICRQCGRQTTWS
jgi:hypothetical protein